MKKILLIIFLFLIYNVYSEERWWNDRWKYRGIVENKSLAYEVENFPIECEIDFGKIFDNLGISKEEIDVNSIRVIEKGKEIPYYIEKIDKNKFILSWVMPGKTLPEEKRKYEIYFDILKDGKKEKPAYILSNPPSNLVPNFSFEEGKDVISGWSPNKDIENENLIIKRASDTSHSGEKSIYLERKTLGIARIETTSYIEIFPSIPYLFEFWCKTPKYTIGSSQREKGSLGIGFVIYYDENEKCLGQISLGGSNKKTEEWEKFSRTYEFPVNARRVKIQFEIYNGIGGVYFDDIKFKPILDLKLEKVQEKGKEIKELREKEWFEL